MNLNIYTVMCACIMLAPQSMIAMEGDQPVRHRGPRVYDLKKMAAITGLVSSQLAPVVAHSTSQTAHGYHRQSELPELVSVCACVTCFVCVAGSACGCCSKSN